MRKLLKVVKVLLMVVVAITVLGYVVMHLWNWLMPPIFGLTTITYWQALGLFVLSKLLLSGFKGGRRHDGPRWGRHMREKWEQMSPEQREKLREGMRGARCGWGHRGPWGRGEEFREEEVRRD
ncbi:hypothetical protein [Terriglobus tenax]|uniref:hypothetical protein n=1 Tax=Terriglobus tenax TaxID=1111115 RepID=UPI0021DFDDA7|nr:hypothetical protein [Terriglobus tenax]